MRMTVEMYEARKVFAEWTASLLDWHDVKTVHELPPEGKSEYDRRLDQLAEKFPGLDENI